MTFQTSKGTYGARQPGRAMVWINRAMAQVIKRTGRIGGSRALLLTTVGRKHVCPDCLRALDRQPQP